MAPDELHRRILLYELSLIARDFLEAGDEAFWAGVRDDLFDETTWLVWADWLDERGSVLGEMVRVQVELSRTLYDWRNFSLCRELHPHFAPFGYATLGGEPLIKRRWELWLGLYGEDEGKRTGRTTRVITDLLRNCCESSDVRIGFYFADSGVRNWGRNLAFEIEGRLGCDVLVKHEVHWIAGWGHYSWGQPPKLVFHDHAGWEDRFGVNGIAMPPIQQDEFAFANPGTMERVARDFGVRAESRMRRLILDAEP